MLTVAIHQPQYLPWVPYCGKAGVCDLFVYLDNVQYQKNGVQNRNQINTSSGPLWLTVPVHANITDAINQVQISDQRWRRKHIQAIEQNYAKAPYVAWFKDGLRGLLDREWLSLVELNVAVTQWMFEALGIQCRCRRASELNVSGAKDDLVINICKAVGASVYLSGHGAKSYQDGHKFHAAGIELRYHNYENPSYSQCHSKAGFIRDLSALDMILNLGPHAREVMASGNSSSNGLGIE
jgi:WbqC-like protein family